MSEQEPEAASEGIVGQSASTGGLARRIVFHWNQAVKETGDGTYPIIIAKFAERIAFDEREACAKVLRDKHDELAKRSYPPPKILLEMEGAILGRSNVEFSGGAPLHGAASAGTQGSASDGPEKG